MKVSASRQAGLWELITTLGVQVGELPADLAAIDRLLQDPQGCMRRWLSCGARRMSGTGRFG